MVHHFYFTFHELIEMQIMFLYVFIKKIWICAGTIMMFCVITRYADESVAPVVTTLATLPISKRKHQFWPVG